jgi:hypothetical protein
MMEKLAQAGEGGGCTRTPLSLYVFTITYKVAVYAPAERARQIHSPYIFNLYPYLLSAVSCLEEGEGASRLTFSVLVIETSKGGF